MCSKRHLIKLEVCLISSDSGLLSDEGTVEVRQPMREVQPAFETQKRLRVPLELDVECKFDNLSKPRETN